MVLEPRRVVRFAALGVALAIAGFWCMVRFEWGGRQFALVQANDVLETIAPALAAAACALALRRSTERGTRLAWGLLGLSALSWCIGQAIWTWYEVVRGTETPFPSLADAGYLLAQPLAIAGLLAFPAAADSGRSRARVLFDGLIAAASMLFIGWALVLGPTLAHSSGSAVENAIGLAYPAGDVAVLAIVVVALTRTQEGRRLPVWLVAGALVALAVADSLFAYLALSDQYHSGSLSDTGWFAGYLCLGLGAVAAAALPTERRRPLRKRRPARAGTPTFPLLVPYIPLLGLVIVAAVRALQNAALSGFLLADAIVVAVLLIGRQVLAILENASLQSSLEATVAELGDRERHFRSLVQRSSDVVSVVDRNLRVTYVSPAVLGVLGYPATGLVGTTVDAFVHPDDSPALLAEVVRLRRDPKLVGRVEVRWRHQREGWRHCETTITNLSDDPAIRGFVLNTRDVTERKEAELELAHRARHDALTGLHTRGPFVELLASTIARAGPDSPVAVLFVDLDRFKVINDSLGHDAGDDVLTVVASRFMAAVAGSGAIGRFGGDEFVAVLAAGLEDADPDEVAPSTPVDPIDVAHRLLRSVRRPMTVGGREVFLSCSIGVATTDQPTTTPDALIRDADVAMYAAKERGRNCVEVFGPGLRGPSVDRLDMESELHRGAARGEFLVLYQPVFDLSTGAVSGFEALARWQHPTRGLLLPDEFLQAAEDTGLIVQIGAHIIRTACGDFAALRRAGHAASVMINLSARQLAEPDIVETIERAVREAHVPTSGVCFEVTEGVIVDAETPVAALRTLRGLGYRLAVDDFGTGYASLTHLRRLPITALKVDRSFVAGLGEDDGATAIVAAITHMARALGISVVAEGIETHEQVAELRAVGCPYGQGYLLGPPVRADRLVTVVEQALAPGPHAPHDEHVESGSAVTAHGAPA